METTSREGQPPFSIQERDRRWAMVRSLMGAAAIEVLVAPDEASSRYLTQMSEGIGATVLPLTGEVTAFGQLQSWDRGAAEWVQDLRVRRGPWVEGVIERLDELGADGSIVGIVGLDGLLGRPEGDLTYHSFVALREYFPHTRWVGAGALMREARYSKSAEEVAYLEEAVRAAEAGLRAAKEGLRAGLGRGEVWGQMVLAMACAGSDVPPLAGVDLLRTGEDGEGPGGRTGASGIFLIHTRGGVSGYAAAVHQPVALGSLPSSWQEAWHVFLEAWRGTWEVLRPGVPFERVAEAAQSAGAGPYRVRQVLRGQGLGDDLPWIPAEGAPLEMVREPALVEGACFLVQPEILWTEKQANCRLGWGDTVLVTGGGPRRLGSRPIEFPVL